MNGSYIFAYSANSPGRTHPLACSGSQEGYVWPTCKNVSLRAKKAVRDAKKPPENPVKMEVRHAGFATRDAKIADRPVKLVVRQSGFAQTPLPGTEWKLNSKIVKK